MYTGILFLLGIPLVSAVMVSTRSMTESDVFNRLAERNRVVLYRVARDVRKSIVTSTVIGGGGTTLSFTQVAGVDATGMLPGENIRYELLPAAGETVNGIDDDGDGLVDEGSLVRRNLTTGEVVTITAEVNVVGSSFALNGSTVTATIATFGRLRNAGDVYEVSRSVNVNPRN